MEHISLGLGFDIDIEVAALSLSFFVGLGDELAPFHWLVSPISGTAMLQVGATDTLGVKMQAGIGVGLAIDVALVSGSASIVIVVQLGRDFESDRRHGVDVKVSAGDPAPLLPPCVPPDVIDFINQTFVTLSGGRDRHSSRRAGSCTSISTARGKSAKRSAAPRPGTAHSAHGHRVTERRSVRAATRPANGPNIVRTRCSFLRHPSHRGARCLRMVGQAADSRKTRRS